MSAPVDVATWAAKWTVTRLLEDGNTRLAGVFERAGYVPMDPMTADEWDDEFGSDVS